MKGKLCACCPLCGGEIVVSEFIQISREYKVTKSGKLSKRYTTTKGAGGGDPMTAACANQCGAYWEDGSFYIGEDGGFYDLIYHEEDAE